MIPALLHGKLTESQENLEDLLTSSVFGLLSYVAPNQGLLKLLACATYADGTQVVGLPEQVVDFEYEFWPWMQEDGCHGAEPDVLIHLTDSSGVRHVVLVEAKYRAGKSSFADWTDEAPTDQLAKEWDNFVIRARAKGWTPHMLYLTDDYGVPRIDLNASAEEYRRKRPKESARYPLRAMWLSWRHLSDVFKMSSNPVLKDLYDLAKKYSFTFFTGISPILAIQQKDVWAFGGSIIGYSYWPIKTPFPKWRFSR